MSEYQEEPQEPPYNGPDGGLLILSAVVPIAGVVIGICYCIAGKPKQGMPLLAVGLAISIILFALRKSGVF